MSNCIYSNCPNIQLGGNGDLRIESCQFYNIDAIQTPGWVEIIEPGASITVRNSVFRDSWGSFFVANSAVTMLFENTNFTNILTDSPITYGTLIVTNYGGSVVLNNVHLKNITLNDNFGAGIIMIGGNLTMNGGSCIDGRAYQVGCISCYRADCVISNYLVVNAKADLYAGAFHNYDRSLTLNNVTIINSRASYGAVFYGRDNGQTIMNNVTIINTLGTNGDGAAIYLKPGATLTMNNGNIINATNTKGSGGFLSLQAGAIFTGTRVTLSGTYASVNGGGVSGSTTSVFTCTQCTFTNASAGLNGGFGFFDIGSKITLTSSTMTGMRSGSLLGASVISSQAAVFYLASSTLILRGSTIRDAVFLGASNGAGIITASTSRITIDTNSLISGARGSDAGAMLLFDCTVIIKSSTITDCASTSYGGAITAKQSTSLTINNTVFTGNYAADSGGAIALFDHAYITSQGLFIAQNNVAENCGGVIFSSSATSSQIGGPGNLIQTNAAELVTQSNFGCIRNTKSGIIDVTNSFLGTIDGDIFTDSPQVSTLYNVSSLPTGVTLGGLPSRLTLSISTPQSILLSDNLPEFTVSVVDYFGNANPNIPVMKVIVALHTEQGNDLLGRSIGVIDFPTKNSFKFTGIKINGALPGLYTIAASGLANTVTAIGSSNYASFNLTIEECTSTQTLDEANSRCLDQVYISPSIRFVMGIASMLAVIVCLLLSFYLKKFQSFGIVKANSYLFLQIGQIGSILSLLSISVMVSKSAASCSLNIWLENLGFVTIFSSFVIKMNRIYTIFNKKRVGNGKNLQDGALIRYYYVAVAITIGFLAAWQVISAPTAVPTLVFNSYLTMDRCASSTFSLTAAILRLTITLIASFVAYTIRDVPSGFNESKAIGFCAYNWVIFGTFISLLSELAIVDATVSFAVRSLSIILPNVLSVGQLVGYKIYQCIFAPNEVKVVAASTMPKNAGSESKGSIIKVQPSIKKFHVADTAKHGVAFQSQMQSHHDTIGSPHSQSMVDENQTAAERQNQTVSGQGLATQNQKTLFNPTNHPEK
jgi:hypothetical protein